MKNEQSKMHQSFSHGRTKKVTVASKRRPGAFGATKDDNVGAPLEATTPSSADLIKKVEQGSIFSPIPNPPNTIPGESDPNAQQVQSPPATISAFANAIDQAIGMLDFKAPPPADNSLVLDNPPQLAIGELAPSSAAADKLPKYKKLVRQHPKITAQYSNEAAEALKNYENEVANLKLGDGPKRRRTGPHYLVYLLLKSLYKIGRASSLHQPYAESDGNVFAVLFKSALLNLAEQKISLIAIDQKKLGGWRNVCTFMLRNKIEPELFFDTLTEYGGIEAVRKLAVKKK
jgi:hypothetical protein